MSKLLKLKQWLTTGEAAKYLSGALSEPVTEADIFRLALDGQLTLSVYFIASVYCKFGRSIPIANARKVPGIPINGMKPYEVTLGVRTPDGKQVLDFEDQIRTLDESVLDLPMIGGERINCERKYQELTNGPSVELTNIDGTFLRMPNTDYYFQIHESYMPKPQDGDTRNVWERYEELVWFPVGTLSDAVVFVVRIESLTKLLSTLSVGNSLDTEMSTRERRTLLTIIGVLCKEAKLDYKTHSKTAGYIESTAAKMGVSIGESTIESHLKKIPDALETRMR